MSLRRSFAGRSARFRYLKVGLILLLLVASSGWLLSRWMTQPVGVPLSRDSNAPQAGQNIEQLFELAVTQMQRRDYQSALKSWHQILLRDPEIPEVKVNLGFTLYELGHFPAARDFFVSATEQNPYQANAYYGLALISEKTGDLESALGAMRTYIHLAGPAEDERFIRRARAALWEWESQLSPPAQGSGAQDGGANAPD